jgi:hypothetical protein
MSHLLQPRDLVCPISHYLISPIEWAIPRSVKFQAISLRNYSKCTIAVGRSIRLARNLVFPLDRLREMKEQGKIGAIAPHLYSFMGSIVGPSKLMKVSAPEITRRLSKDTVDVVFSTPV